MTPTSPRRRTLGKQGGRFVLVGLANTALHAAVALCLIRWVGLGLTWANVTAFIVATGFSYVLNTTWSFATRLNGVTLSRFFVVSAIGVLLAALVSLVAEHLHLRYLLGVACVPLLVTPVTFTLHRIWTYR